VELDPRFAAVPIGKGAGFVSAVEQQPDMSERFVVRGTVEVDSVDEVPTEIEGRAVFADPAIEPLPLPLITCGGAPLGNAAAVQAALKTAALASKGLDGADVAIAIVDTGINTVHLNSQLGFGARIDAANSWNPPGSTTLAGKWPVGHGTMCAYDALIVAPKATLLDYPVLSSKVPGGAVMSGSLSVVMQAYAFLIGSWAVAFAHGGLSKYKALVVSNSWGMYHPSWDFPLGHPGRYCDNPNHPFHILMSSLVASGADVVFAAGNCGANCPDGRCLGRTTGTIMGSNAHGDVVTVAGCDTSGMRVGYSSQGPSIAGMPPQKPDIAGYTHFLGSEVYGPGSPDGGTSAACPVVAGCIAALRSKLPHATTPPRNLYIQLMADAATPAGVAAGWNGDYGHGIIDPIAAATSLGLYP
jgi:subtilisin family serine protease